MVTFCSPPLQTFDDPDADELSGEYFRRGATIAKWYAGEMLRLKEGARASRELSDAHELLQWLQHKWKESSICVPVIAGEGPNRFRDTKMAKALIRTLVDHNWLIPIANVEVKGKRRKEAWKIVRSASE